MIFLKVDKSNFLTFFSLRRGEGRSDFFIFKKIAEILKKINLCCKIRGREI